MMFFRKNDGAISVLLIFVLIPCLLFSGSTIDIAKMYASKVIISDAGEMALNAGLAQYESSVLDQYGLLLMENTPDSMQTELQEFFDASLNGTGIDGDYSDLLHLATESFEAISIEASNICKSEVEKQQIIEYMKYRAPICIVELVLEKFKLLKDTKKITKAMEKQIDFAESMDDCQDAIEDAEIALNALNAKLNEFPDDLQEEINEVKEKYTNDLSKAILMLAIISNYSEKVFATDVESLALSYIEEADKVNLNKPLAKDTFDAYMKCLQIDEKIRIAGGIDGLNSGTSSGEETSEGDTTASDNSSLIEEYNKAKQSISKYEQKLNEVAQETISFGYNRISGYIKKSADIVKLADKASKALKKVKKEFDEAEEDYDQWSGSVGELEDGETKGSMQSEVKRYKDFFDTGEGSEDMSNLDKLMNIVEGDKTYFGELESALKNEKFWDESIGVSSVSKQKTTYSSNANQMVKGKKILVESAYSSNVETIRKDYITHYSYALLPDRPATWKIADDPFYKKVKEYSKKTVESEEKKEETDKIIQDSASDASDVTGADVFETLTFNWESVSDQLISAGFVDENVDGVDLSGTVENRSSRKNLLKKYKEAIQSATNFMDGVDRLLAKNIENLYIAEYAMQMFSCYTSNKDSNGIIIDDERVLSLSRYQMSNSPAYLAESEYILWGNNLSAQNVSNTLMMIFAVRLLLNSIYTFTDAEIKTIASSTATAIAGAAPYLVPVVTILIQVAFAAAESGIDIKNLALGKEVAIIKSKSTWTFSIKGIGKEITSDVSNAATSNQGVDLDKGGSKINLDKDGDGINLKKEDKEDKDGDGIDLKKEDKDGGGIDLKKEDKPSESNKSTLTFNYQDYLRIFINLSLIGGKEENILNRIADCIQINTEDYDLRDGYTMMGIHAEISLDTSFIGPLSRWAGGSDVSEDYTIPYNSVLGY